MVLYVSNVILNSIKKRKTIENKTYATKIARRFTTLSLEETNNYLLRISQSSQLTYKHI